MASDPKHLIVQAFSLARERGKPDWSRMSVAVLKNRMIQLSHGDFDESQFGARTFREFIAQFPELVQLEDGASGSTVKFVGSSHPQPTDAAAPMLLGSGRLREDLWSAVMDYSGGVPYFWDGEKAVRQADAPEGAHKLPTINEAELASWRAEFTQSIVDRLPAETAQRVREWQQNGSPTFALPPMLRVRWNTELKRRAAERLLAWFSEVRIEPPADMFRTPESARATSVEILRATIVECVRVMTQEELAEVRLPAAVVARARDRIGKLK